MNQKKLNTTFGRSLTTDPQIFADQLLHAPLDFQTYRHPYLTRMLTKHPIQLRPSRMSTNMTLNPSQPCSKVLVISMRNYQMKLLFSIPLALSWLAWRS